MYTEAMCNFCSFLHASKTSCPFLIVSILWKLKIERYFLDILYYFCKYKRSDGLHRIGYNRIIHLPDHLILWTVTGTVDAGRISGTQPVSISVLDFVSYGIELQQGDSVFTAERSIGVHFVGFRHFPTWTIKIIGIELVMEQGVGVNPPPPPQSVLRKKLVPPCVLCEHCFNYTWANDKVSNYNHSFGDGIH